METLSYTAYEYERRTKPAEALASKYPRAAAFERMYQESLQIGFADFPPMEAA